MLGSRLIDYKHLFISGALILGLVCGANAQSTQSSGTVKQMNPSSPQASSKIGKPTVVPNLIGKTKAAAETALKKSGLKIGTLRTTPTGKGKPNTVVRQKPTAKKRVAKGSGVDLWLLKPAITAKDKSLSKRAVQLKPRLYPQKKKLLMEFPKEVRNLVIYDSRGKALQRFKGGRRFDITASLNKTNAGRIIVGFDQAPGEAVPRISYHRRPEDHPERMAFALDSYRDLASRYITIDDARTIERNEPDNDTIAGATRISAGFYTGELGREEHGRVDATDYLKAVSNSRGFGTLVEVNVESGNVELHLYDPIENLKGSDQNKIWIALTPSTTFYFQVTPTGPGITTYRLRISYTTIQDPFETNDTPTTAPTMVTRIQDAFLGNVINSAGTHVGVNDWYKVHLTEPQNLRLVVENAGLDSTDLVHIYLYQPDYPDPDASNEGLPGRNADGGVLQVDLRPIYEGHTFPVGNWRILVTTSTAGAGYPEAFGTGDPPDCYTQETGYSLTKTVLP